MAEFLSAQWLDELNHHLRAAGPIPLESGSPAYRLVLEFLDAPSPVAHAMTFTMSEEGGSISVGDHLAADATVSLSYNDALALTTGRLDSATALREGRVKVRGDINTVVPLLSWLQLAHPQAEP